MATDSTSWELLCQVGNIRDRMPFVLDLDEFKYHTWRECFKLHCHAFGVLGHIDGTSVPKGPNDDKWEQIDAVVQLWICNSISEPLLVWILKEDVTAKDLWKNIEDYFCVNKDARVTQLVSDLGNMQIGDLSVEAYSTKIIRMANFLITVLDAPVSDATLVMCLIKGLGEKYKQVVTIIRHREPLLTFNEVCSMLRLEESRLSCQHQELNQQDNNGNHLNNMENSPHQFLWDESQPSQPNYSYQELNYQVGIDVLYDPY